MSGVREFKVANFPSLGNGMLANAVDKEIKNCIADLQDRPRLKSPRTVTLQLSFVPVIEDEADAELENVLHSFTVSSSLPKRASVKYTLGVRRSGHLHFSEVSNHNPDQMAIDFDEPETAESEGDA